MATERERPPKKSKRDARAEADRIAALERQLDQEQRKRVELMAGIGLAPEDIALLIVPPVDVPTLKMRYAVELERGPALANQDVVLKFNAAVKKGNTAALIFWLKARMGWSERGQRAPETPAAAPHASETAVPTALPTNREMGRILRIVDKS